jgi:hypothetical protein
MTKDEALDLALEALENGIDGQTSTEMDKAITAIKQALAAPAAEGWKLVPVEPTQGMVKAFQDAMALEFGMRTTAGYHARVYSAMLAAAPEKGQP